MLSKASTTGLAFAFTITSCNTPEPLSFTNLLYSSSSFFCLSKNEKLIVTYLLRIVSKFVFEGALNNPLFNTTSAERFNLLIPKKV